ncbi:hypothetical protein CALCODRAFT_508756 [Calocera cornea HHB12733]|uniref:Uncharacterized protein n=1 Tax=Calocera cornea HHB12733 TaxID=1353952 RepID=A0A165G3L2_9BASI|nr:hypothetical protein CALCODRAFT_508756 [Calocera cornea HHB12733]
MDTITDTTNFSAHQLQTSNEPHRDDPEVIGWNDDTGTRALRTGNGFADGTGFRKRGREATDKGNENNAPPPKRPRRLTDRALEEETQRRTTARRDQRNATLLRSFEAAVAAELQAVLPVNDEPLRAVMNCLKDGAEMDVIPRMKEIANRWNPENELTEAYRTLDLPYRHTKGTDSAVGELRTPILTPEMEAEVEKRLKVERTTLARTLEDSFKIRLEKTFGPARAAWRQMGEKIKKPNQMFIQWIQAFSAGMNPNEIVANAWTRAVTESPGEGVAPRHQPERDEEV